MAESQTLQILCFFLVLADTDSVTGVQGRFCFSACLLFIYRLFLSSPGVKGIGGGGRQSLVNELI